MYIIIELLLKAEKLMKIRYGNLPPDLIDTLKQLRDWVLDKENES